MQQTITTVCVTILSTSRHSYQLLYIKKKSEGLFFGVKNFKCFMDDYFIIFRIEFLSSLLIKLWRDMLKDARLITMYKTAKENVAITYNKQETYKPPLRQSCHTSSFIIPPCKTQRRQESFPSYDNPSFWVSRLKHSRLMYPLSSTIFVMSYLWYFSMPTVSFPELCLLLRAVKLVLRHLM